MEVVPLILTVIGPLFLGAVLVLGLFWLRGSRARRPGETPSERAKPAAALQTPEGPGKREP